LEGKIKTELPLTGCDVVDWICLAQDKIQVRVLVSTVIKLTVPKKTNNFLTR
jgi:hypothetical protein